MNKSKNMVIIIILGILLLLPVSVTAVTFVDNQVVDANKIWTIYFNQEVVLDNLSKQGVRVMDSKDNNVDVTLSLGKNNRSIIVKAPLGGYTAGEKYKLIVNDKIHTKNNKVLKTGTLINFSIVNNTSSNNVSGNINGNILNGGLVAQKDNWFYLGGEKLTKVKSDGSISILLYDESATNIIIVGDWIYFKEKWGGSNIIKMKTDGTDMSIIEDTPSMFYLQGDWIYSIEYNEHIHKIKTDGTCKMDICDDCSTFFYVEGDWIYYTNNSDDNKLYKIKIDGTCRTKLTDDMAFYANVQGDWIYYANDKIYKIKTDGTSKTLVSNDWASGLNVSKDWIYYGKGNDDGSSTLYKIKTDGTSRTSLKLENKYNISVIQDYIFFYDICYEQEGLYKMKNDGSNMQCIN